MECPAGLGVSGAELWNEVSGSRRLSAANRVLLLNMCRIADRLDELTRELSLSPLVVSNNLGSETPNPLLTEHRMQVSTLSQLMQRLGIAEVAKVGAKVSVRDQMAEKRAQRAARVSGS